MVDIATACFKLLMFYPL